MDRKDRATKLIEWFKQQTTELASLYKAGRLATSSLDLKDVLNLTTEVATHLIDDAKVCTLRFLSRDKKELTLQSAFGLDFEYLMDEAITVEGTAVGKVIKARRPYKVGELMRSNTYRFPRLVKEKNLHSFLSVPILKDAEPLGAITIYAPKRYSFSREDVKLLSLFANHVAFSLKGAGVFKKMRKNYLDIIKELSSIVEAKDEFTKGHSERVTRYALKIARALGIKGIRRELLRCAGILHDIGKVAIDTAILNKPGKLTREEWAIVKQHPVVASDMLTNVEFLDELVPIVRHHHERFAGGGYPDGVKSDEIPLESRILAVADSFEAMTSERPYRSAMSKQKAIAELKRCSGTQFDPAIVNAFLKTIN